MALLLTIFLCSGDDTVLCNVHACREVAADKERRYLERAVDAVIHRDENVVGCDLSYCVYLEKASGRGGAIVVKIDSVVIEKSIRSLADAVYRRHLRRIRRRHLHQHSLIDDLEVAGSVERPDSRVRHHRLRYRSSQNVRAGSVLRGGGGELQVFVEWEVAFESVRIVLSEGGTGHANEQ
jgi:hypothetical protein